MQNLENQVTYNVLKQRRIVNKNFVRKLIFSLQIIGLGIPSTKKSNITCIRPKDVQIAYVSTQVPYRVGSMKNIDLDMLEPQAKSLAVTSAIAYAVIIPMNA